MAGFELGTSGIGSDRSTNWATTTALFVEKLQKKRTEQKRSPSILQLNDSIVEIWMLLTVARVQ